MNPLVLVLSLALLGAKPEIPTPPRITFCPEMTDTVTEITLRLRTDDPKKRDVSFLIDWGDGSPLSWTRYMPSGTDIYQYYTYRKPGTMVIRARARAHAFASADTLPSEWSQPCTVQVKPSLVKWKYPLPGGTLCAPALDAQGNIYFGDESGRFHSLTPEGKVRWQFQVPDTPDVAITGAPAVGEHAVYFGCEDTRVYALALNDGKLLWTYKTALPIYSAPALGADGMVYVADDSGIVYCLNNQGILKWTYPTKEQIDNGLTIGADGTIYVPSDSLYALAPAGRRLWAVGAQEEDSPFYGVSIGPQGDIFASNMDGYVYRIEPKTGRILARVASRDEDEIHTEVTFGPDNTAYFGSDDYYLNAWTPGDTTRGLIETDDHIRATSAINSKGTIYCLSMDGNFYCLAPSGKTKWQKPIGTIELEERWIPSSPVIGPDGTVYIGSFEDGFYAFYGDGEPLKGKWSMFRGGPQHTGRAPR